MALGNLAKLMFWLILSKVNIFVSFSGEKWAFPKLNILHSPSAECRKCGFGRSLNFSVYDAPGRGCKMHLGYKH